VDVDVASLIVRQHLALVDEGIGPKDVAPGDAVVLAQAVRVARDEIEDHDLWEAELISDAEHAARVKACPRCERLAASRATIPPGLGPAARRLFRGRPLAG